MQRRHTLSALTLLLGAPWAAHATSPATESVPKVRAPEELSAFGPAWVRQGSGALRFFGFKAYDAHLWRPADATEFSFARPFGLDIRYDMSIKGSDIVNTSLIELSRITPTPPEKLQQWSALMSSVFVDVKAGDRLVGVHLSGRGARFFLNGRLQGETGDTAFSEAFFRIWLDPNTKRPELRSQLLGLGTPATVAQ
jgi:hypothetical protein